MDANTRIDNLRKRINKLNNININNYSFIENKKKIIENMLLIDKQRVIIENLKLQLFLKKVW